VGLPVGCQGVVWAQALGSRVERLLVTVMSGVCGGTAVAVVCDTPWLSPLCNMFCIGVVC